MFLKLLAVLTGFFDSTNSWHKLSNIVGKREGGGDKQTDTLGSFSVAENPEITESPLIQKEFLEGSQLRLPVHWLRCGLSLSKSLGSQPSEVRGLKKGF